MPMLRALVIAAALAVAAPAAADVIPPPEEITEVQQALVGAWQQTATTGMMGHGEGLETLAFDKERFGSIYMFALPQSAMYQATTRRGTWSGERVDAAHIRVTLTSDDGAPPQTMQFRLVDARTLEATRGIGRHGDPVTVTYTKVYP